MKQEIKAQVRGYIGRGVREAYIDEAGHLIFVMSDRAELDLGEVIGPHGVGVVGAYIDQTGHLRLKMSDEKEIDAGTVAAPVDATLSIPGQAADAAETGKVKGLALYASQRADDAQTTADDAKLLAASAEQKAENAGQMAAEAERTAGEAQTRADEAYNLASQGGGGSGGGIHVGDEPPTDPNFAGWLRIREPSEVLVKAPVTAKVGQMLRVAAVDENGVPTQWEAVDLPSGGAGGGGITPYYRVACMTTEEEAVQVVVPLSSNAIKRLNAAEMWMLDIKMTLGGSTNTETTLGNLTAEMFSSWGTNVFFTNIPGVIPTTAVNYAYEARITALYRRGIDGTSSVFATWLVANAGVKSAYTDVRTNGMALTSESLRLTGSINIPSGTKIVLYAVGEMEVVDI